MLHQLFDAANERPWLWLVYMIGLLIPICVMTMIFCPVKRDKEEQNSDAAKDDNYDAIHDETKEEEALRKKTDQPIPDVVDDELQETTADTAEVVEEESTSMMPELEDIVPNTTPVKQNQAPDMQKTPEKSEAAPTTPTKEMMTDGASNGTSNGFDEDHDEDESLGFATGGGGGGKSVLNGIHDEDEILRRSPRFKSKTRSRKE